MILVHICCSVDSHYFLQKLQNDYPAKKLIGFFYDPNIHPYSEYYLRLLDVKRSCRLLDIELIEGDYDVEGWLKAVRGLESEPEKGARCSVCFDNRFEISAKEASRLNIPIFTSTLLTSPKKSLQALKYAGDKIANRYGIEFIAPDYRKASGTQEQNILAKKDKLYRQDYCGCIYGLTMQREYQNKLVDELISPISNQILPESIESRIKMYHKREELEEKNIEYKIIKQRFLNYRLLYGYLKSKQSVIEAHFLPYSTIRGDYSRGKIEYSIDDIFYFNRDEVKFITLEKYNQLANKNYKSILELIFNPPPFEEEIEIKFKISQTYYDLGAILVVENIPTSKLEIICQSKTYDDVKELLNFVGWEKPTKKVSQ
ncbi:FIG053235: Diacylglucosamine hydrolase like [hydrothermal vent metagenome]|uniref:FIG053235: Diacylglucosamine hydrolase like n=1 Tax=hydrothermal vent metagenome TaxID=652676 RepID=A0A1W1EHL4_9ZZZZ